MKKLISLMVLALVSTYPGAGYAQNSKNQALTVKVPFDFVVGNRTFPAGIYRFRSLLDSAPGKAAIDVLEVRAMEGRFYAAVVADVMGNSQSTHPKLVFARSGGRTFLSEVWENGKAAACRLSNIESGTQASGNEDETVTLVASADWR